MLLENAGVAKTPPQQPEWLLVYRNAEDRVAFMEINAVTARLLALMEDDGTTFCSGHGVCGASTYVCTCDEGWKGSGCEDRRWDGPSAALWPAHRCCVRTYLTDLARPTVRRSASSRPRCPRKPWTSPRSS